MEKNIVERGRPQIDNMAHAARWISKATDTHLEHATIIDFPLQQWLRERASVPLVSR